MSGLVKVKYKSFPTSLLYIPGSAIFVSSILLNFANCSIGVCAGLLAKKPTLKRTSRVYFILHKDIPFVVLATSRPKKYFKNPRSLSLNLLSKIS